MRTRSNRLRTIAAWSLGACTAALACAWALLSACSSSSSATGGSTSTDASDAGAVDNGDAEAGGGPTTPIRYVVVLVKENHTFDNMFGTYPGANGTLTATLSDGGTITRPTIPPGTLSFNPNHFHSNALTAWADGGMNGFDLVALASPTDAAAPSDPLLPFGYYAQADIPNYWKLAGQYVLCDAFFTHVLADSFPAYISLIAAQSPAYEDPSGSMWACGDTSKVQTYDPRTCSTSVTAPCFSIPSVVDSLPDGVTWRSYTDQYGTGPLTSPFDSIAAVHAKGTTANTRLNSKLLKDLAAGDLANITYIWGGNESEHPPDDICPGENDTVAIANALMKSPHWNETLLIVTWDDWGGFYDHVAPQMSPCPGGRDAFNLGFRVPTLLISPYAKKGLVYHTPTEQSSIPRLIEDLFGLPRMSSTDPVATDGTAGDLLGAFDFSQAPAPGLTLTPRTCP
jgi:phospholipase C